MAPRTSSMARLGIPGRPDTPAIAGWLRITSSPTFNPKGPGGSPALHGHDFKTFLLSLVLGRFRANSKLKTFGW